MTISTENIRFFKGYFQDKAGILLADDKTYLLEGRLAPVARKLGLKSFDDLIIQLRLNRPEAVKPCLDAITTNETYFFRDIKPFDHFNNKTVPKLKITSGKDPIRILSAACSSGQEAYSLAMIMLENKLRLDGKDFEVIGLDISPAVIDRAKEGVFNQFEIQRGLPISYMVKYFNKVDENHWQIKQQVRDKCEFKEGNLLDDLSGIGEFDCIFARNVLIYFDDKNKQKATSNLCSILKKEGTLYLGSSETVNPLPNILTQNLDYRSIFYRL